MKLFTNASLLTGHSVANPATLVIKIAIRLCLVGLLTLRIFTAGSTMRLRTFFLVMKYVPVPTAVAAIVSLAFQTVACVAIAIAAPGVAMDTGLFRIEFHAVGADILPWIQRSARKDATDPRRWLSERQYWHIGRTFDPHGADFVIAKETPISLTQLGQVRCQALEQCVVGKCSQEAEKGATVLLIHDSVGHPLGNLIDHEFR